ncbi:MAG TPA: hypothetical protein VFM72_01695 [Aequorivita sp.]|nr:hypothetical protein [Aequorivita sp.]
MKISNFISLYNFDGAVITTIISVIVCFAIIGGLFFYVRQSKKRKNMVQNRKKPNDTPEKKG